MFLSLWIRTSELHDISNNAFMHFLYSSVANCITKLSRGDGINANFVTIRKDLKSPGTKNHPSLSVPGAIWRTWASCVPFSPPGSPIASCDRPRLPALCRGSGFCNCLGRSCRLFLCVRILHGKWEKVEVTSSLYFNAFIIFFCFVIRASGGPALVLVSHKWLKLRRHWIV